MPTCSQPRQAEWKAAVSVSARQRVPINPESEPWPSTSLAPTTAAKKTLWSIRNIYHPAEALRTSISSGWSFPAKFRSCSWGLIFLQGKTLNKISSLCHSKAQGTSGGSRLESPRISWAGRGRRDQSPTPAVQHYFKAVFVCMRKEKKVFQQKELIVLLLVAPSPLFLTFTLLHN